jgi:hypothetical protein
LGELSPTWEKSLAFVKERKDRISTLHWERISAPHWENIVSLLVKENQPLFGRRNNKRFVVEVDPET